MISDKKIEKEVCETSIVDPIDETSENSNFDKSRTFAPDKNRTLSSNESVHPNERRNQFRNRPHRLWRQSTEEYYLSTSSSGKGTFMTSQTFYFHFSRPLYLKQGNLFRGERRITACAERLFLGIFIRAMFVFYNIK